MKPNAVCVTEDMLVLPTAGIGFDNPNTLFMQTGGHLQDCTYPCAFHNHFLREELVDKEYRRISFENEFLIAEFLPELGGRIWRLYDKLHAEEVVHKNDCVKPYPGGFGGAYTAGGIELNYPFAHSITNTWPRKTEFQRNDDGSATYTVSEWERVGRTQWAMSFTLSPGEARLKQKVMIYNRSKQPASFCYWGNAGVPIDDDTKWIYREVMGSEHGYTTVYTWPEYKGLDLSWYKNNPEVVGIYFLEPGYDFFGYVNVRTKSGLMHYSDRHDLPGKKLWTWGRNFSGEATRWHLCVDPQDYGEVQSGRIVNQEHFEWLMPEEYLTWTEQWSPIHGLTYVTEATDDCAFQILPDDRKLAYYPFVQIKNRKLEFVIDGRVVKEMAFSAEAGKLGEISLEDIPAGEINRLEIRAVNGEQTASISLKGRCERRPVPEVREDPIFDVRSSMAYCVNAEFSHKLLRREKAMEQYRKAIELDQYNYQAYTGLGLMLYSHGDLEGAKGNFRKSIDCYKWNAAAYLMLSHIHHLQGDLDEAMDRAHDARYYGEKCRANIKLGELSIARGRFGTAMLFFEEAISHNIMSLRSYALASLCQRKLGRGSSGSLTLEGAPLKDLMSYSESWFQSRMSDAELREQLFDDEWRFLELALNYVDLGLYEEACALCDVGISIHQDGWQPEKIYNPDRIWGIFRKRETPFFHMLKGYIAAETGKDDEARTHFTAGDYFEYFVNANQPEMLRVLRRAVEYGNISACHYLGNFMYHSHRPDEALKYWLMAEGKLGDCSVNTRNLAVHARYVEKDLEKARLLLRKALAANPNDLYVRLELIAVERECGACPDEIVSIYLAAPEEQRSTYLHYGLLGAYMAAGEWEVAAEHMRTVDRSHSDTDSGWYDFCLRYADHLIDGEKPADALTWIGKCRPNPPNLTYVNSAEEWLLCHRRYYLEGLAHKMLGDEPAAAECFRKAVDQPATLHYFKPWEDLISSWRMYVALAMKELGMDAAAQGMLCGINKYRETAGLIPLRLEKSETNRWAEKDPDAVVVVIEQTGPEI